MAPAKKKKKASGGKQGSSTSPKTPGARAASLEPKKTGSRARKKSAAAKRTAEAKRAAALKSARKRTSGKGVSGQTAGNRAVDRYVDDLSGWQQEVVADVRQIVKDASPDSTESVKWGQPVYEQNGPFAYVKAHKNSVNLGFWRGADLKDPKGLLEGSGANMRHVKIKKPDDVTKKEFQALVKQAVKLNLALGDPSK